MTSTKIILYLFWFIYILAQFLTLSYSPLPWFDETMFAGIAWNFIHTGLLIPKVAIFEEVNIYGPVYFFLTGISLKIGGFSIFYFRLINLLAGIGCLWVLRKIIQSSPFHFSCQSSFWLITLIAIDPFFYLSLHEGRMDLTAIFWILWAIRYLLKPLSSYKNFIFSAIFTTLALLTTPRVGVILIGISLVLLLLILQNFRENIGKVAIWGSIVLSAYFCWILYAFGGLMAIWRYYTSIPPNTFDASPVELYLRWNGYIPRQEYLLILLAFLAFVYGILRKPHAYFHYIWVIGSGSILFFYVFVFDYGPYSIYILFFYYLFIFRALQLFTPGFSFKNPVFYFVLLLTIFNLSYFTFKNIQIATSIPIRDFYTVTKFIQKHIPKGSKVIGEPMYFYAVLKTGSDYQYMDLYETLERREKRQREVYQYDYMIITDHIRWRKPVITKYYLAHASLQKVAKLAIPVSNWTKFIEKWIPLSSTENDGYNCTIYRHRKENFGKE